MICRHNRTQYECEQCRWEMHEQAKRFDQHVANNLQIEREAIERSPGWQRQIAQLSNLNLTQPMPL